MLVLTDIFYEKGKLRSYKYSMHLNSVRFNIKDTDTGIMHSDIPLFEILKSNKDILGVLKMDNDVLFIRVDIVTWMLLDYIDKVKILGVAKDFLEGELIEKKIVRTCELCKYRNELGVVYSFKLHYPIRRLDKLGIFWQLRDDLYCPLSNLYHVLYDIDCSDCIAVYLTDSYNSTIKLDVNKNISRLMTKAVVMEDTLHW